MNSFLSSFIFVTAIFSYLHILRYTIYIFFFLFLYSFYFFLLFMIRFLVFIYCFLIFTAVFSLLFILFFYYRHFLTTFLLFLIKLKRLYYLCNRKNKLLPKWQPFSLSFSSFFYSDNYIPLISLTFSKWNIPQISLSLFY